MEPKPYDFLHFQCSIHIDAPPERVWEFAGDVGKSAQWAGSGAVLSMEQTTSGPVGVGTRYVAQEKIGFRFQSESIITAYEPNRLIIWETRPIGMPMPAGRAHRWAFRLTPEAGGTLLVQELCAAKASGLPRLMQRIATLPLIRRSFFRGITRTMDNIKRLAEAPVEVGQPASLNVAATPTA